MTEEPKIILVHRIVQKDFCMSSADGEEVFRHLQKAIKGGVKVALSFEKIELMTSAFLNVAIGKLYGEFDEEKIHSHLRVEGADEDDMALIEHVKKFARLYYKDREGHQQLLDEI